MQGTSGATKSSISATTHDDSYLAAAALADFASQSPATIAKQSSRPMEPPPPAAAPPVRPPPEERKAVANFAAQLVRQTPTGVFYDNQTHKYNVYGTSAATGNKIFLGGYKTEQEAQCAYHVSAEISTTGTGGTKPSKATSKRLLRSFGQDEEEANLPQDLAAVHKDDNGNPEVEDVYPPASLHRYKRDPQAERKSVPVRPKRRAVNGGVGMQQQQQQQREDSYVYGSLASSDGTRNGVAVASPPPTATIATTRGRRSTPQRQVAAITPKYSDDYYQQQQQQEEAAELAEEQENYNYILPKRSSSGRNNRQRPPRPKKAFTVFLEKKQRENPHVSLAKVRMMAKRQWRTKSVEQERRQYEEEYDHQKEVYEAYMNSKKVSSAGRSPPWTTSPVEIVGGGGRQGVSPSAPPTMFSSSSNSPMVRQGGTTTTSPIACSTSHVVVTYNGGQRLKKVLEAVVYPGNGIHSVVEGCAPTPPGGGDLRTTTSSMGAAAAAAAGVVGQPWGGDRIWYKNDYPRESRWTLEDSQNHPIHKYHTTGRVLFFTSPSYHWRAYIRFGGREKVAKWHKTLEEAECIVKLLIDILQLDGMTEAERKQLSYEDFHFITNEAVEAASKALELRGTPTNGIAFNPETQMFSASFEYNEVQELVGEFATPEMAIMARNVAIGVSRPRRRSAKKSLGQAREEAITAVRRKFPNEKGAIIASNSLPSSSLVATAEAPSAASPPGSASSTRRGRSRSFHRQNEEKQEIPERKRSRRAPSPIISGAPDPMDATTEESSNNDNNVEQGEENDHENKTDIETDTIATSNQEKKTSALTGNTEQAAVATEVPVARFRLERYLEGHEIVDEEKKSQYYDEESAWRLHNGQQTIMPTEEDSSSTNSIKLEGETMLEPLPPTPDLPRLPSTPYCKWSFDEESRVLLANFRQKEGQEGSVNICLEDEEFLLKMMERNDVTVISEGIADGLDPELWNMEYIANRLKNTFFHRFRKFERRKFEAPSAESMNGTSEVVKISYETHEEMDVCLSMKVSDYTRYLEIRRIALEARTKENQDSNGNTVPQKSKSEENLSREVFTFTDDSGKEHSINAADVCLYMIDLDMVKLLPELISDFSSSFKLSGCMPGGTHCMMNAVNASGRPFMGPNMYITPPTSFTQMHQDGHGTVDSGHQCLSGYNEVVMLRRLPEAHKEQALRLLSGKMPNSAYDALYGLPHGDGLGDKPAWPDCNAIAKCKEMGYYPSVFILKPGQLVHINKGRLHAFRKLGPELLPSSDCHAKLRSSFIEKEGLGNAEHLCISVAWDWMYKGVTSAGINKEVAATLEGTVLNRINGTQSLAIPELSLLQMAQKLVTGSNPEKSFLPLKKARDTCSFAPNRETTLRGILPSLRYLIDQHVETTLAARDKAQNTSDKETKNRTLIKRHQLSIEPKPNSWENPDIFELDPYGNGDFFCKLCAKELSNVYLHCDGCEKILNKDFNICLSCHKEQRYCSMIQMHPLNPKRHCTINHTGNMKYNRQARCVCKNGPVCKNCGWCQGCSCRCHTWFTLNHRFLTLEEEEKLLETVEKVVGDHPAIETMRRLVNLSDMEGALDQKKPGNGEAVEKESDNTEQEKTEDGVEKKNETPTRRKRTRSSSNAETKFSI